MGYIDLNRCEKVKILKIREIKGGRGYTVRIPSEVAEKMGLRSKRKVEVFVDYENGLIIYRPF